MNRKISIVIPTYQRPTLLVKCLEALQKQDFDYNDYDIIVVSDGPDEKTTEAIASLDNGLVKIFHKSLPQKKGPAAARNLGWLNASGNLIAFTDDDCIPDVNWLKSIWASYDGRQEIAFTGRVVVPLSDEPTDFERNTANLETAEFITANCVCTKKALLRTGGFDERFELAWREDSDLHFKLLLNQIPIYKIDATVIHPVRQAPWGVSLKEQRKGMFNALLYKKYPNLYEKKIRSKAPGSYYLMIVAFLVMIAGLITQNNWVAIIAFLVWLVLQLGFISKRLASTSRSFNHIVEMVVTSIAIPFLSVYWQFYGAWKYRVFFI